MRPSREPVPWPGVAAAGGCRSARLAGQPREQRGRELPWHRVWGSFNRGFGVPLEGEFRAPLRGLLDNAVQYSIRKSCLIG